MENLIGWLLVLAIVVIPFIGIYLMIKFYKERKAHTLREEQDRQARIKHQKEEWAKQYAGATHVGKTQYDYIADQNRTTVTEKATGRKMSYVHETNGSPDLLTTMIVADMLFNNKDSSSGTVNWKDDVPSVNTDEDNRRSSSWGYSSDSGSSFSDNGPSSSDSGPSSDW